MTITKSTLTTVVGILIVIVGVAIAKFLNMPAATITGYVTAAVGLGVTAKSAYSASSKSNWIAVLSVVFIGAGGIGIGVAGTITATQAVTIATAIISVVIVVAGVLGVVLSSDSDS